MDRAADVWAREKADDARLNAELRRLASLTLQQLAAEVMVKASVPGGPGAETLTYADMEDVGATLPHPYRGGD